MSWCALFYRVYTHNRLSNLAGTGGTKNAGRQFVYGYFEV